MNALEFHKTIGYINDLGDGYIKISVNNTCIEFSSNSYNINGEITYEDNQYFLNTKSAKS